MMAGAPRGKTRQPSSPEAARLGDALKERRLSFRGGLRQEDVALEAGISQKIVSQIERGEQDLRTSGVSLTMRLLKALGWNLSDLQRASEIDLGAEEEEPTLQRDIEIPAGLLEAAERFGRIFPALKKRRVQEQLASARFFDGIGPETAEEWRDYYTSVSRWISDKD